MHLDTTHLRTALTSVLGPLALPWTFAALLSMSLGAPLGAQMLWTGVAQGGPAPRGWHGMAYDSVGQGVVLFGGGDPTTAFGDTWRWNGTTWVPVATIGPSARVGHAMACDDALGHIVLFGGLAGIGSQSNETWEWNGSTWTQRFPAASPPARGGHAMAYDAARRRVVLFGGADANGVVFGDTWVWDGTTTTWTLAATGGPSARTYHAMTFDRARQRVVLFGGIDANSAMLGDTWVWDGASWTRAAATGPNGRIWHSMAYDAARERVVLFGGRDLQSTSALDDTWEWHCGGWTRQAPVGQPGARAHHAIAYDRMRQRLVLHGGNDHAWYPGDTWEYHPSVHGATTTTGTGCAGSAGVPAVTTVGPPIAGNGCFALRIDSVPSGANVFVGVSLRSCNLPGCRQVYGPCTVHPVLPFLAALPGSANNSGVASIPLPIPWDVRGVSLHVQGGAFDSNGAMLGLVSLTAGLHIVVGD